MSCLFLISGSYTSPRDPKVVHASVLDLMQKRTLKRSLGGIIKGKGKVKGIFKEVSRMSLIAVPMLKGNGWSRGSSRGYLGH